MIGFIERTGDYYTTRVNAGKGWKYGVGSTRDESLVMALSKVV